MAEQRLPFRFRLPWLPAPAAPRPAPPVPRPTGEIQTPTQPTTTVPIQQLPFRPLGIAPAQPPPQVQAPPRIESPPSSPSKAPTETKVHPEPGSPSSPSRSATESRITSQPASPSHAVTQSLDASQPQSPSQAASQPASLPQSPSRTAPQPQPASQTDTQLQSPSHFASKPAGQTSPKPSPSLTITQAEPTAEVVALPPSPSKKLQLPAHDSSQLPPSPAQPQLLTYDREEQKPALSQLPSQVPESKTGTTSDIVSKPQDQTPTKISSQLDGMAAQPSAVSGPPTAAAPISKAVSKIPTPPRITDSSIKLGGNKPLPELEEKEECAEGKKVVQEPKEEEKINGPAYEEPKQRTVTELVNLASGKKMQIREQMSTQLQTEQKQAKKQEILEKETLTTSASTGKPSKIVISTHPKDNNTVGESRHKPATFTRERVPMHKEIREDISKFIHKLGTGHPTQLTSETPVIVITVSGDNRGATMELSSESTQKEGSIHIRRGYKINPDESVETTTDGEGAFKRRSEGKDNPATQAHINSNVQSVNNSILFDGSITERNPGVQLDLSQNPTGSIKSMGTLDTRRAEYNIAPAEKLTYEPTVRRRCLRGLFMEPSDSDPDNPEKPRRHGCRYNSCEKGKDKEKVAL